MNGDRIIILKMLIFLSIFAFIISSLIFSVVTGSAHDFSDDTWNSGGEICQPCHTPHNGGIDSVSSTDAPLWNHQVTDVTAFTIYTGYNMQAPAGQPAGVSKLCLSCHDGTVGLDAFGSTIFSTNYMTGTTLMGTDLSDDHPISIDWQHQTNSTGGSFWCAKCHNMHASPTYISELVFFNGDIECATCHDVHNTTGLDKLLRITNVVSELCLTCHNK